MLVHKLKKRFFLIRKIIGKADNFNLIYFTFYFCNLESTFVET